MKRWIVFVALALFSFAAFADSVQTIDGQTLEGQRVTGIPGEVVLLNGGVEITVEAAQLASISVSGRTVYAKTTAGRDLAGDLATDIRSVYVKTETGEVQIPFAQVAGVTFARKASKEGDYSASITLTDGRVLDGDLARSFPTEISLDLNGIVTKTRLSAVTKLTFGDPATLETSSGSQSGRLLADVPDFVVLGTDFGSYSIPAGLAVELRIAEPRSIVPARLADLPANSVSAGFKVWGGFPSVLGNLTLGNLGVELGLGYRSAPALYGLIDVDMLFYFANVRYLISLPYVGDVLRPYFGGGVVGVYIMASAGELTGSASLFAVDAFAGIELSLAAIQIPVTFFVATDWAPLFTDVTFFTQFGARVEFRF